MPKYIISSQGEKILYDTAGQAKQALADKGMGGYTVVDEPDSMQPEPTTAQNAQQWANTGLTVANTATTLTGGSPASQIAPSVSTPTSPDPAAVPPPTNQQVAPTPSPDLSTTGSTTDELMNTGNYSVGKDSYSANSPVAPTGGGQGALTGAAGGAAAGTAVMPGWGTAIGAGIGAIGGAMEQGPEETELQESQGRIANVQADQAEMSQAAGEKEALPVRTKMPILSGLPSGPLRAPQRAAWAMQYGLSETAPKPTSENLDYLRSHPDTPMSTAAAKQARLQAQENRLRIAKMILYPLAILSALA